jgi:hypothetical protein
MATSAASERILSLLMVVCMSGFLGGRNESNTGTYVERLPAGFPMLPGVGSAAVRYHPQAL